MRILYDYQCFTQPSGGVSRYFSEIGRRIALRPDAQVDIPVLFSSNVYLDHPRKLFPKLQFHGRGFVTNLVHRSYMRRYLAASKGGYDLFHPTYYDGYFLPYLAGTPYVVTVHDMIHELFARSFDDAQRASAEKRRLVEQAARVIAVSENTKNDLMKVFAIPDEKIAVVYHGNSLRYDNEEPPAFGDYLLYIGARNRYKNFAFMLEALRGILKGFGLRLVCVGGGAFLPEERTLIRRLGLEREVAHTSVVSDGRLASLYHHAAVFVYPSLYEGFGIPLLEAFGCGCPVAASSRSSLPEVGGDGADYFDPEDAESIRTTVARLLDDKARRESLVARGSRRLRRFSWDEAARRTYEIYEGAVSR